MNILKIGDRYINPDTVTRIDPVNELVAGESGTLELEFVGRNQEDWGSTWVTGVEATELRRYLDRVAVDITAPTQCTCDECQKGYR